MLSNAALSRFATIHDRFLAHTYTRTHPTAVADDPDTEDVDESQNPWFEAETATDVSVTGVACLCLNARPRERRDSQGNVYIEQPTIRVAVTDTLDVGDFVSDLRDQRGSVLIEGRAKVTAIEEGSAPGVSVGRRVTLSIGRVV